MTTKQLKQASEGDLQSIEQLCLIMWEPLYRFIYYKVQNREEAEDITQETFVKTLTYLQKHEPSQDNYLGFMKTVGQNIIRDRWRQKIRRGIQLNFEEINPAEPGSLDNQESIVRHIQIENALLRLNNDQRAILDLRIIQGYSVADTAKLLGKTEAAVRTSQYRALHALAQILDNE